MANWPKSRSAGGRGATVGGTLIIPPGNGSLDTCGTATSPEQMLLHRRHAILILE